jgi:very-short-patch-repair endonuclease
VTAHTPLPPALGRGPFSVRDARAAGSSAGRLRGGDLERPFHGVRDRVPENQDRIRRCHAYQQWMPGDAFFCGVTAAAILNIPLPYRHEAATELHVAVPAPHRAPRGKGIVGHAIQVESTDTQIIDGLRISSTERTWFDLGAILLLSDLVAATDFLIRRNAPLTTPSRLAAAMARYPGRRGRRALRQALDLADARSESRKESQLRLILAHAQLAGLVPNLEITTSGGFCYRADLAFPEQLVLVEYQSNYHGETEQFRADMTRRSRLEADGWYVFYVNADDLHNPEELVARIRSVLFKRAQRAH